MSYNPFTRTSFSKAIDRPELNQTGTSIPKGAAVGVTSSGMMLIDVSSEESVNGLSGVTRESVLNSSSGLVVTSGTIENIITPFPIGSTLYINKVGLLTATKPTIGVEGFGEGDFVIKVGVVAQNATLAGIKDLIVQIQIMGVL